MPIRKDQQELGLIPQESQIERREQVYADRRGLLASIIRTAETGSYHAYMDITSLDVIVMMEDPRYADHGTSHFLQLGGFGKEVRFNCGVVGVGEREFKASLPFIGRPFEDALRFHDIAQVINETRVGHQAAGALHYDLSMASYCESLKEGGERRERFLRAENEARTAIQTILEQDSGYFQIATVGFLKAMLAREKWTDDLRRLMYENLRTIYPVVKDAEKKDKKGYLTMRHKEEWHKVIGYLQYLDSYVLTLPQRRAAATMIWNHDKEDKIMTQGISEYTPKKAIAEIRQALGIRHDEPNDLIYEKLPSLIEFKSQIEKYWALPDEVGTKFTKEQWRQVEKWSKLLMGVDLFWTIYSGMLSVIRTVKTSARMPSLKRPLFEMNRKPNRSPLRDKDDYARRSQPIDKYPDDLWRWIAECHINFKELCNNDPWFMQRVAEAYRLRLQAIEDFAVGIMDPKYFFKKKILGRYEEYMISDINLTIQNGHKEKEPTIRSRYRHERRILTRLVGNKKIGFAIDEVGQRLPDKARDPNLARFVTLLKMAREEIEEAYPLGDESLLISKGYDLTRIPVPYIPVL